jgi:hypothetical protein
MPIADLDELWALIEGRFDDVDSAIAALGNPWEYPVRTLTMSSVQVASLLTGNDIAIVRGDTLQLSFEGLGSLVGNKKVWFTIKENSLDIDTASIVMIEKTDGLKYLNKAIASTPTDGNLAIDDEALGNISITLAPAASTLLATKNYYYDIQWKDATDQIFTIQLGKVIVLSDITRAVV